jgi:hypothetical protein
MIMRYLVCFLISAVLIACTFPPQRQPEPVTQAVPEPPYEQPTYEPPVIPPAVEVKAKPVKAKPLIPAPAPSIPPNPCLGIEAPELKEEIHEKLDCINESLK